MSAEDNRPILDRADFLRRVETMFPQAAVERTRSGELVIYTGWMQEDSGDTVLRWGEKP